MTNKNELPNAFFMAVDGLIDASLVLKIEAITPSGSIKHKTALSLIEAAERSGELKPGGMVIESTSGNLGISLAAICAKRGYGFTCVVDPNVSKQSVAMIEAFGGKVERVSARDAQGGYLGTRIELIKSMQKNDPALYWTNQYANPANPAAHAQLTAVEIAEAYPDADWVVVGAGTTGTLMGFLDYFDGKRHPAQVLAVDSMGSITFGGAAGPRFIPGLGTSRIPEIFQPEKLCNTVVVPERDAVGMCRWLARSHGYLSGGSTGSILAGVQAQADLFSRGSTVVALSPDGGEKYLDTIYNDRWVQQTFGSQVSRGARPVRPVRELATTGQGAK
ncbi:2,3-diaminopropionate biosynthesis protein SbnA [Pseudophaeobacter leonis]|uniref:2,3-diaminopropionate biosynthesis protein SbnA n=1 Tax=Pseudophaeobacter leonis TaxID=1144477 RepID=UPI0009F60FBE|nr:2,3-diaminopropionate biosynthesis protein SbnA [Pseudophaeobacter leonis]